jgi:hypothetical protein
MALSAFSTFQSLNLYGATSNSMNKVAKIERACLGAITHNSITITDVIGSNVSYFSVGNNNKRYFPNRPCKLMLPPNTVQDCTITPFNENGFAGEPYTILGTAVTHATLNSHISIKHHDANSLTLTCNGIYSELFIETTDKSISGVYQGQEIVFNNLDARIYTFIITPINCIGEWNRSQTKTVNTSIHTNITMTGGAISSSKCGRYKIHTFTSTKSAMMSLVISGEGIKNVNYFIVGAGGRGNYGGGGGGGYKFGSCDLVPGAYPIHISVSSSGPSAYTSFRDVKCYGGGVGGSACCGGDGACGGGGSAERSNIRNEGGMGNHGHGGGCGYRDDTGDYSGGGGGALEDGMDGNCAMGMPGNGGLGFDLISVPILPGYKEATTFCYGGGGSAILANGTILHGQGGSDYGGGGTGDQEGTPGIVIITYETDDVSDISHLCSVERSRKTQTPSPPKASSQRTQTPNMRQERRSSPHHSRSQTPIYQERRSSPHQPRSHTPVRSQTPIVYELDEISESTISVVDDASQEAQEQSAAHHHVHLYLHSSKGK